MGLSIRWSTTLPGYGHHLLVIDRTGTSVYAGDGWGAPSYASLSLRLIDMRDGRELKRLRTKYQQPRSITYRGQDLLVATDSRLFQLSSDLILRSSWESRIPRFSDALALESDKLLMTNWLRPTAAILDLTTGRSGRLVLEPGLRPLRRGTQLMLYALRSGLLRHVDLASRTSEVILRGPMGLSIALAAERWLGILTAGWGRDRGGVEQPARETRELIVYDLNDGTAVKRRLSRDTVAIEGANDRPIFWLLQRAPGLRLLPSIVERVNTQSGQTVDTLAAPIGSDVVQVAPDHSVVFFGRPHHDDQNAVITCAHVS